MIKDIFISSFSLTITYTNEKNQLNKATNITIVPESYV